MSQDEDPEDLDCVKFRLQPEDLRAAYRTTMTRNRRVVVYATIIFVAIGSASGWTIGSVTGRLPGIATAIGAVLGTILLFGLMRSAERRQVRAGEIAGLCQRQTLKISEQGYELAMEDGRKGSGPWKNIIEVGISAGYFFIRVDQDYHAIFFPIRHFRSESHANMFYRKARLWHAEATQSAASPTETLKADQ